MPEASTYNVINDVVVNKITKAEYDLYVSAGIITQEQIENQVWIFSDDNYLSAENLAKLNALNLEAITGAENTIEGIKVNGEAVTPDESKIVNIVVPTKASDLENDSGFITNTVENLSNFYNKTEVNALISTLNALSIQVVAALPTANISDHTLYLVPKTTAGTNNVYNEYLYTANGWELIGDTAVSLENYYTKTDMALLLAGYAKTADLAAVATSGSYNDLTDKPTIPTGSVVLRIWHEETTE